MHVQDYSKRGSVILLSASAFLDFLKIWDHAGSVLKKHNCRCLLGEESDIVRGITKTSLVITGLDPPGQMGTMDSRWHHPLPEGTAWGEF